VKVSVLTVIVISVAILITFYACRHQIPFTNLPGGGSGGPSNPPTASCDPDTVYFVNDIMPIISSNCTMSGCHDNISHKEGVNLTSYANIKRYVSPGNAPSSKLYKVIVKNNEDRMPPPPMPPLSQAQKDKIAKWINQGATNNNCMANCDTAVFTYSGAVKPIMDSKCSGCHNPASLGGNIDVSSYNALKVVALNGKLMGSVADKVSKTAKISVACALEPLKG
jgi:hypothetical protein